jgi:hypothetical protein
MSRLFAVCICLVLLALPGTVLGSVQVFDTKFGKVQINTPFELTPRDDITTDIRLPLVKPDTRMPVLNLVKANSLEVGEGFESFATSSVGPGHKYDEATTNDGHRMVFTTLEGSLNLDGNPTSTYYAFIDLRKDKNAMVKIAGDSETINKGEVTSTLSEGVFQETCKSFVLL